MDEEPQHSQRESLRSVINEEKQEFARPASRESKLTLAVRALRHRNFQLFFAGQLISLIGTWMQTVAQSWLVYRMTGSALLLGAVGFASQIPVFLMAPVGGIVADRYNRRRVVIATQVLVDDSGVHSRRTYAFRADPGVADHGAGIAAGRG